MSASRLRAARTLMEQSGIDALLLSVGADLPYFTGYRAMPLERLTMLVLPAAGEATLVVPQLEAPRVEPRAGVTVRPWGETEDPVALVADLVGDATRLLLGDTTWAVFLLGLQAALPGARFGSAAPLTRELRMRKDRGELEALRAAAEATDRVVARLDEIRFSGQTERSLSRRVAAMTLEEGHHEATFAIVASGPNAASPHHEPGDRVMQPGDTVVVDFGGRFDGYCSDTTRTFSIGEPSGAVAEAFEVLHRAHAAGVAAVRPGVAAQDVDAATRGVIADAGYGEFFIHRTGHGIGLEEHEHPYIVAGNELLLESGMTFSIEPGIYVPDRFGMRIEDIVATAPDGVDPLNRSPHRLHIVA